MTSLPESVILDGLIYHTTDPRQHKLTLKRTIPGCAVQWYEQNGVRSWLIQSPKGQWFQVITRWNEGPEGKLLTEQEAILLTVQYLNRGAATDIFGDRRYESWKDDPRRRSRTQGPS